MPKCIFCGNEYDLPHGVTEINLSGKARHFCSSKCRKNFALGRDSRKIKWTKTWKITKQKKAERARQTKKATEKEAEK